MVMKTSDIRSFMRSLPILASVLGKRLGVKVQIGGLACTDGKTIYLPPLPLDGGEELFILTNGFLDHEAAHVRETNFEELQASNLSPLGHNLFNLVEDVRVERELTEIYPGCREHFKKMYRNLTKDAAPGDSSEAGKNIFCWLMNAVFHEQYPDVGFPVSAFSDAVHNQFPSLIPQLEQFIQPGLVCASTMESIAWGQSVERFLLQYFEKSKPQSSDQAQPSSDGEPEAGNGDDAAESSDPQPGESEESTDDDSRNSGTERGDECGDEPMADSAQENDPDFDQQGTGDSEGESDLPPPDLSQDIEQPPQSDSNTGTDEDGDDSEADADSDDVDSHDDEPSGTGAVKAGSDPAEADNDAGNDSGMGDPGIGSVPGHGESESAQVESGESGLDMLEHLIQGIDADELTEEVREALGDMVNSEGEMPRTLGDILKQILQQVSRETSSSGHLQVAVVKGSLPGEMPKPLIEQAQSATKVMATRLSGLLQTQTLARRHTGRRGRVDGPRLHRLAAHNPRVFQRPSEKQSVDTAVHILLDCSSSMEECMSLANAACFSVASALHRIRGVNVGVTAFPGIWEEDEPGTVAPILKHGQRMHTRFPVESFGSTPMGEAVWWTCQELAALKEERKIILLLTDGYPDSMPNTEAALDAARAMGIEIIGIGIGQYGEFILKLIENSRVINEIEELAPAMFGVLQTALTAQRNIP